MNFIKSTVLLSLAAVVLPACGGEPRADEPAATVPAAAPAPMGDAQTEPAAPLTTPATRVAPAPAAPAAPTAADSAAARAEDVSPEWKQRARQGESYASCMEKTRNASESARPLLVAACGRLPDAPR